MPDPYERVRQQMVEQQLRARGIRDERVLAAMRSVPRHEFVHEIDREHAYEDRPSEIGENQTISQPYIVAVMLEALELDPDDRVLEIGTGSGYQTAILAELASRVYSVERHRALGESAGSRLSGLGYRNVQIFVRDGSRGLAEFSPYDAIVVSAAAPKIPESLFAQLREGGRMVIPVGGPETQQLQLVAKEKGAASILVIEGCRFVPLVGREGYGTGS